MSSKRKTEPSELSEFKRELMRVNGVQAVGESVSNGEFCFKVFFLSTHHPSFVSKLWFFIKDIPWL